jgi:membrane associated rhomboid family serine protease
MRALARPVLLIVSAHPSLWLKTLIAANVAIFIVMWLMPSLARQAVQEFFGLLPAAVFRSFRIWQPVTYMFLHGTIGHIFFNMIALWMFGTELERIWGTRFFLRYYFITGIFAALTTIVVSLLPYPTTARMFHSVTIGASGAIYGLLLAYGRVPEQTDLHPLLLPIPSGICEIMGLIAPSGRRQRVAVSRTLRTWWVDVVTDAARATFVSANEVVVSGIAVKMIARVRSSAQLAEGQLGQEGALSRLRAARPGLGRRAVLLSTRPSASR